MISIDIKHNGKMASTILSACRERIRQSSKQHTTRVKQWRQSEETFTLYMPESANDELRRLKREDGTPQYTTIQMPYSYAVAMAAHSYWSSIFLSRSPVLQYMGNTDEGEDQVLAVEALHNYQMFKGNILPSLYIWLQDVPKYGEAWLLNYWREDKTRYSSIEMVEEKYLGMIKSGSFKKKKVVREVISYQGNSTTNIHPSKVFTDPRYTRGRFQEGEFVAIETELSRNQLVVGAQQSQYINIDRLVAQTQHGETNEEGHYEESADPLLERPNVEDFSTYYDPKASDVYEVYEFYITLIPKLWKLSSGDMPEKWVFTVDKNFTTVIEARPMGNIHDKYPLTYLEIEPEGYAKYSRSMIELFSPIQNTIDWLINSHFFNVRQVLNNQWLMDPSRVEERDFETNEPGLAVRLKPAAYGTDVRTALMQLPVSDVTQAHMSDLAVMYDMGERLGVNDPMMGITSPSSRRTAQEIRGDQSFGVSRLKTNAEYFSATGFSQLASMFLSNSQQFYNAEQKLRIAGHAAETAGMPFLNVTPESIAGQYSFEPVDGTLPVDRFAMVNLWQQLITNMYQVPQVVQQYDLGKIFGYVAQLGGIKNLNRFKVEILPDEQMANQAAAGNAVPIPGGAGNPLEPGQIPGVGPTA